MAKKNKEIIELRKESPIVKETKALREKVKREIPNSIQGYNLKQFYCDRTYFRRGATREFSSMGKVIKKGIETLLMWGEECPNEKSPDVSLSQIDFIFVRRDRNQQADKITNYIKIEVDHGRRFDILYQKNYRGTSDIGVGSLEVRSDRGW